MMETVKAIATRNYDKLFAQIDAIVQSSKDIAKAVGLTVSNVDTRTHRALNKLRKMFGGNEV